MFRSLVSFLLIITVLAANLSNCMIYVGFDLNQKYIATTLCENRDKPELHCNGKCYLSKKIKQAEEKEKNQEQQSQKNRFQEAMITQKMKIRFSRSLIRTRAALDPVSALPTYSASIFQPPRA